MKKIFLTLFCAVFLLALPTDNIEITDLNINSALTQNITVSSKEGTFIKLSTGEGSANTREEAIRNALSEAISKMRGFSTENFTVQSQDIPTQSGFVQRLNTQIYKASKGRIDSYEITSIEEKENGSFLARVTVFKTLFTKDEKPTVAIFNASTYKDLGDSLQQRLTNELIQGKKFKILDRKNSAYYKAEKELMQSEDASGEDLYKLGNVLGADYMLVFNLRELGASSKGSKSASITVKDDAEVIRGDVVVDYRLILFATRELKASNTLTMSIKLKDSSIKSNEEAMSKIAKAIFVDLSDTLNPLFVSMVDGKEVLFEEKLELGSFYDCASQTSTSSGKIQITKSNAKNSQAQILKGEVGLGDLCKLALENGKDATYVLGSNGGVSLGW